MSTATNITAVIVTHNSPPILKQVVERLLAQTVPPRRVVIVDSGSNDAAPIAALTALSNSVEFIGRDNIGFAAANNLALRKHLRDTDYFVLVNPDVVLDPDWFQGALSYLNRNREKNIGILASPLRGMDVKSGQPTGLWDSLGIYRHPTGRWYDRGQLQSIDQVPSPARSYEPTAMVGALLFFAADLVEKVSTKYGFFDERYVTFKEDIELSLRVSERGLRLVMLPELIAYHCRGWPKKRFDAPYWTRRLSAVNDVRLAAGYFPWRLPIYLTKFAYVTTVERWLGIARNRFFRAPVPWKPVNEIR